MNDIHETIDEPRQLKEYSARQKLAIYASTLLVGTGIMFGVTEGVESSLQSADKGTIKIINDAREANYTCAKELHKVALYSGAKTVNGTIELGVNDVSSRLLTTCGIDTNGIYIGTDKTNVTLFNYGTANVRLASPNNTTKYIFDTPNVIVKKANEQRADELRRIKESEAGMDLGMSLLAGILGTLLSIPIYSSIVGHRKEKVAAHRVSDNNL